MNEIDKSEENYIKYINSRNYSNNRLSNNNRSFFHFIVGLCVCFITYQGFFILKNCNELIKVKLNSLHALERWDIQIKELEEKLAILNNESLVARIEVVEANIDNGTFDKNKLKNFSDLQEQVNSLIKDIYQSENKQKIKDFGILLQDFQLFKEQLKNEYQRELYDYKLKTGGWFVSIVVTIILTTFVQNMIQKFYTKRTTQAVDK